MEGGGRGRGVAPPAGAGRGGLAAPPGGGERKTQQVQRKPLETGERVSIYGLDLDNLRFDVGDRRSMSRGSQAKAEDASVASLWQVKGGGSQQVKTVDGSDMFGSFDIHVNSAAKAGTELGFEFKAILDNDYQNFSADDFDVDINASSIVLSGVSKCAQCQQSIVNPSDGVTAFGKAYHRTHVKCCVTGKDFSGGGDAFEGDDGQIYCQAEWEKKFQKNCNKCKQPIRDKKPLVAKDKFYHRKCFVCTKCGCVLEGRWYEEEGQPICENDYFRKKGLVCPVCTKPVEGEGKVVGKFKFHPKLSLIHI